MTKVGHRKGWMYFTSKNKEDINIIQRFEDKSFVCDVVHKDKLMISNVTNSKALLHAKELYNQINHTGEI